MGGEEEIVAPGFDYADHIFGWYQSASLIAGPGGTFSLFADLGRDTDRYGDRYYALQSFGFSTIGVPATWQDTGIGWGVGWGDPSPIGAYTTAKTASGQTAIAVNMAGTDLGSWSNPAMDIYVGGSLLLSIPVTEAAPATSVALLGLTTPIADQNAVTSAEAAAGFAIGGSESGADGRTVTVEIVNASSQVVDTLTTTAAGGAWSVNLGAAQAQALANGSYTVKADVSDAAGYPAVDATQAITVNEAASSLNALVSFDGANGDGPLVGLIADANGDLFGTTENGGANGDGTIFEIVNNGTPAAPIYASTPTTLVSFDGANGQYLYGGLIADANGDLFGTTERGGASGDGTLFEIAKTVSGYANAPTTLINFNGGDGQYPVAGLIADAHGDLFGTTSGGGANGYGTVFEIVNNGSGVGLELRARRSRAELPAGPERRRAAVDAADHRADRPRRHGRPHGSDTGDDGQSRRE